MIQNHNQMIFSKLFHKKQHKTKENNKLFNIVNPKYIFFLIKKTNRR